MAAMSRWRSRPVTPALETSGAVAVGAKSRSSLIFNRAVNGPYRQTREDKKPRPWKRPAVEVQRTPGASFRTPQGSLRRIPGKKLQQSIHVAPTERALSNKLDHVWKWLSDLPMPRFCRKPSPETDIDALSGIARLGPELARPSHHYGASVTTCPLMALMCVRPHRGWLQHPGVMPKLTT